MSMETCALVPTLVIKRIPDHIQPAGFLWCPVGKSVSKATSDGSCCLGIAHIIHHHM